VRFDGIRSTGWAFSVPELGNYGISFESVPPGVVGDLSHSETLLFSADELGDNLYDSLDFNLSATPTPEATEIPTDAFTLAANVYRLRRKLRGLYLFTAVLPEWGSGIFTGF
jgi:hypothetical protein